MEERKKEGDPCTMTSLLGYIVVCMVIWLVSRFLKEVSDRLNEATGGKWDQ